MSADEDGLVRAVIADPWDELSRSAYADWLEEQGEAEHAALMRGQGVALRALEPRLVDGAPPGPPRVFSADGLLGVQIEPEAGAVNAPGVAEWARRCRVSVLGFYDQADDWRTVAESAAMSAVRGVLLDGGIDSVPWFSRSPAVTGLAWLGLRHVTSENGRLIELARSEALPGLVRLGLAQPEVGIRFLEALEAGPLAGRLEHLDLSGARMGDRGVEALARCGRLMGGLVALQVGGLLGDRSAVALASSPHLGRLKSLRLDAALSRGVRALASSPLFRRLHWLSLPGELRGSADDTRALVRAAADVPGLRLHIGSRIGPTLREELREMMGQRLTVG
jgi:uncharacterized protein (TIGR02996 family)